MKKVYVVTQGEYSDYGIIGIWSRREDAQRVVDAYPSGNSSSYSARIEEWELDKEVKYPPGKKFWFASMNRDGSFPESHPAPSETEPDAEDCNEDFNEDFAGDGIGRPRYTYCWAKDMDQAVKIANDRRRRAIAENRW